MTRFMINLERNEVEALKKMADLELNNVKVTAANIIHRELIKCGFLTYTTVIIPNETVTPAAGDKLAE
jgi:putative alpha-1,2-mannosidase